jgi:hypothetical protein
MDRWMGDFACPPYVLKKIESCFSFQLPSSIFGEFESMQMAML